MLVYPHAAPRQLGDAVEGNLGRAQDRTVRHLEAECDDAFAGLHLGDIDCKPCHVAYKLLRRRRLAVAVLRLEGKFRFQVARPELLRHGKTDDELHAPGRGNVAVRR